MEKYIYDITYLDSSVSHFDILKELNRRGQEGWELVAVISRNAAKYAFFWKRKIIGD